MNVKKLLPLLGILVLSISCEKNESPKNNEAKLIKVTCSFGNGIIDTATNTVIIKAPESTDITQVIPQFELSENATIYPPSGVATDFSSPVTYTITSGDNTAKYIFKAIVIKPIVRFTVYDCSNWTPTNMRELQANATIKIYTKPENVGTKNVYDSLTTDLNAQAVLYGLRTNNYYITASKSDKSNIINGYVLQGTYNTQDEVDNGPDPNAKVGGLRIMDWNGDGRITLDDKSNYQGIWSEFDLNTTVVIAKDLYIAK